MKTKTAAILAMTLLASTIISPRVARAMTMTSLPSEYNSCDDLLKRLRDLEGDLNAAEFVLEKYQQDLLQTIEDRNSVVAKIKENHDKECAILNDLTNTSLTEDEIESLNEKLARIRKEAELLNLQLIAQEARAKRYQDYINREIAKIQSLQRQIGELKRQLELTCLEQQSSTVAD